MAQEKERTVRYPENFLSRPCDRLFLTCFSDVKEGGYYAYRIWADFASGGSDRRVMDKCVSEGVLSDSDKQVLILEMFCGWSGDRGSMIRSALDSGFLELSKRIDGNVDLVCCGFYPLNNQFGMSMQKKGALSQALVRYGKEARLAASGQMGLFDKVGHQVAEIEMSAELKADAVSLVDVLCRVMHFDQLSTAAWTADLIHDSAAVVGKFTELERRNTFIWLMDHRNDSDIPKRVDLVVKAFAEYQEKAGREIV